MIVASLYFSIALAKSVYRFDAPKDWRQHESGVVDAVFKKDDATIAIQTYDLPFTSGVTSETLPDFIQKLQTIRSIANLAVEISKWHVNQYSLSNYKAGQVLKLKGQYLFGVKKASIEFWEWMYEIDKSHYEIQVTAPLGKMTDQEVNTLLTRFMPGEK